MKPELTLFTRNQSAAHQRSRRICPNISGNGTGAVNRVVPRRLVSSAFPAHAQTFIVLYSFTGGDDGRSPSADLVSDAAGNLYAPQATAGPSIPAPSDWAAVLCSS